MAKTATCRQFPPDQPKRESNLDYLIDSFSCHYNLQDGIGLLDAPPVHLSRYKALYSKSYATTARRLPMESVHTKHLYLVPPVVEAGHVEDLVKAGETISASSSARANSIAVFLTSTVCFDLGYIVASIYSASPDQCSACTSRSWRRRNPCLFREHRTDTLF